VPVQYRMTVHLFQAPSSPGCLNFGFKKIATDNECEFGSDTANFIRKDFYVEDGLVGCYRFQTYIINREHQVYLHQRGNAAS